jgi:putative membrane protein insertion efficiency factor
MGLVRGYRLLLKPWLGNACRFEPTCSAYALQALQQHGALRGGALTGWRILRCHPYCNGGCDPVPDTFLNPAAGLFTRLGLRSDAADASTSTRNLP